MGLPPRPPPPLLRRVFPSLYLLQFEFLKPGYTCCKSLSSAFVWSNWEGKPHSWAGPLPSIESVTSGKHYANAAHLSMGVFEFRRDLAVLRLNEVVCNNLPSFGWVYSTPDLGQNFSPLTFPSKGIRWLLCECELVTILIRIKAAERRFNKLDYCVLPCKAVCWSCTIPRKFPRPFYTP